MEQEVTHIETKKPNITCGYCGQVREDGVALELIGTIKYEKAPQIHGASLPVIVAICIQCLDSIVNEVNRIARGDKILLSGGASKRKPN